jgi:hypothetical protein
MRIRSSIDATWIAMPSRSSVVAAASRSAKPVVPAGVPRQSNGPAFVEKVR